MAQTTLQVNRANCVNGDLHVIKQILLHYTFTRNNNSQNNLLFAKLSNIQTNDHIC